MFVGEGVTSGGNVTSTVAYAYNGRYESGWTATLPAGATPVSASHNIGAMPRAEFVFECITTDAGYAVGDHLRTGSVYGNFSAGSLVPIPATASPKTASFIGGGTTAFAVPNKTTAAAVGLTAANWKYKIAAQRPW